MSKVEFLGKNEKRNILRVGSKLEGVIPKDKLFILNLPMKLPMIVKPKPCNKKKGGGYLLNGVEYNEPLITNKLAYINIRILRP